MAHEDEVEMVLEHTEMVGVMCDMYHGALHQCVVVLIIVYKLNKN